LGSERYEWQKGRDWRQGVIYRRKRNKVGKKKERKEFIK
jgi:hypothetical protein